MDPGVKESILVDLRLANAFFEAGEHIVNDAQKRVYAYNFGKQMLEIAITRMRVHMAEEHRKANDLITKHTERKLRESDDQ